MDIDVVTVPKSHNGEGMAKDIISYAHMHQT